MYAVAYRLILLCSLIAYMAAIYVALHIIVAHFSKHPGSKLRWFFTVLTTPLLYPFRAIMPARVTEAQLRYVTLVVCLALWFATRLLLAALGGPGQG
jgi:uncharacterized protein YggT (Ycf19 family)